MFAFEGSTTLFDAGADGCEDVETGAGDEVDAPAPLAEGELDEGPDPPPPGSTFDEHPADIARTIPASDSASRL